MMDERKQWLECCVRYSVNDLLAYSRAANIILPLGDGRYVAIGTLEGIRGLVDAEQEGVPEASK